MGVISGLFLSFFLLVSCFHPRENVRDTASLHAKQDGIENPGTADGSALRLAAAMRSAELPEALCQKLLAASVDAFFADLLACLAGDRHLRELVDKRFPLAAAYIPADLVVLADGTYRVSRAGLMLRAAAAASLDEMAAAARAEGITLIASSAYRSYDYQAEVYDRVVREMGREAADRESARPGHSQHQTGLVVDFGPIDDSFAQTSAGRWMADNALRFGWSLSYPDGYEAVTGYRWESWHYRYVGGNLAAFIDNYFDGTQQHALRFLREWELDFRLSLNIGLSGCCW